MVDGQDDTAKKDDKKNEKTTTLEVPPGPPPTPAPEDKEITVGKKDDDKKQPDENEPPKKKKDDGPTPSGSKDPLMQMLDDYAQMMHKLHGAIGDLEGMAGKAAFDAFAKTDSGKKVIESANKLGEAIDNAKQGVKDYIAAEANGALDKVAKSEAVQSLAKTKDALADKVTNFATETMDKATKAINEATQSMAPPKNTSTEKTSVEALDGKKVEAATPKGQETEKGKTVEHEKEATVEHEGPKGSNP